MNWSARLLNLTTGGFNRRTETKHYLTHSNASKFKYWHSFSFKWKHFKTSSSSPDSQSSAVKWRDESALFSYPLPPFLPKIDQMGLHLHAWELKAKHIEGKYDPDLSSQIWVSYISDINKIFLFLDMCKGKGFWGGIVRFSSPDPVFNPQRRTRVKLITGRQTQFKADFGGTI